MLLDEYKVQIQGTGISVFSWYGRKNSSGMLRMWFLKNVMGFIYRVVWILRPLWIILSEIIKILRNLHPPKKIKPTQFLGCLQKYCHTCRFIYIAPSSNCSLVTLTLPFQVILRRFEVLFWCMGWECCIFQTNDENSFQSTKYYTMALVVKVPRGACCGYGFKFNDQYCDFMDGKPTLCCVNIILVGHNKVGGR